MGPVRRLLVAGVLLLVGAAIGFAVAIVRPGWPAAPALVLSELPGEPMDLEVVDGIGYATLATGSIVRIVVVDGRVTASPVMDGLGVPRGLAMTDDTVYVVDERVLPCVSGEGCPSDPAERERFNIESSNARVLAYQIRADGTLGAPRTVTDGIPVVSRDHGANDLDVGPDGMLYLAVGGFDYLWRDPGARDELVHPRTEMLGSIVRIDPDTGSAEVWATGLRNVYGLAFSPGGRLLGVDNDGQTLRSWRQEELLELSEGLDYGYPIDGSFGPYDARTGFPIFALPPGGHAGIAWLDDSVVVGSCAGIQRVPLVELDGELEVRNRVLVEELADVAGCVTSIVPVDGGLLVAAYGASGIYFIPNR